MFRLFSFSYALFAILLLNPDHRYHHHGGGSGSGGFGMIMVDAVIPQLGLDLIVAVEYDNMNDYPIPLEEDGNNHYEIVRSYDISNAWFGSYPPMKYQSPYYRWMQYLRHPKPKKETPPNNADNDYEYMAPPDDNPFLCNIPSSTSLDINDKTKHMMLLMMIPRGNCTFQTKSYIAQTYYHVDAVVIYGTLSSRYQINDTTTAAITAEEKEEQEDPNILLEHIIWPQDKSDYDCTKGRALISYTSLSFQPLPYNAKVNDPIVTGNQSSSLCYQNSPNHLSDCSSQMCLFTGQTFLSTTQTNTMKKSRSSSLNHNNTEMMMMEACCAWDLHIYLYPGYDEVHDPTTTNRTNNHNNTNEKKHPRFNGTVTIPVGYMTARQYDDFMTNYAGNSNSNDNGNNKKSLRILMYTRWRPFYNASALLIWVLGTFVAAIASYLTASDYHQYYNDIDNKKRNHSYEPILQNQQQVSVNDDQEQPPPPSSASRRAASPSLSSAPRQQPPPPPQQQPQQQDQRPLSQNNNNNMNINEEILELTPIHALGFVIMSSTSLLILFYFKIYGIVKIFYALGCSTATTQVILSPLIHMIFQRLPSSSRIYENKIIYRTTIDHEMIDITLHDMISYGLGYTFGMIWLYYAVYVIDADTYFYFWFMQDVFGTCMCITFLKVIRLNSIRVASILLIVAFFYDIFFVFITPYLFSGKSVMITVATSGGPPKADELYCEKYPHDVDCQGGHPMPMLLALPKFNDYLGGSSLLGLGDIVLPGLLLSFAARYDAAKALIGLYHSCNDHDENDRPRRGRVYVKNPNIPCTDVPTTSIMCGGCCTSGSSRCCGGTYFIPLVIAYAIGLAMANIAVYMMKMGQPALLYLVPCCLGTLIYIGYTKQELQDLWDGPKLLKTADDIISQQENYHDDHDDAMRDHPIRHNNSNNGNHPRDGLINHSHERLPTDDHNDDDDQHHQRTPLVPSATFDG